VKRKYGASGLVLERVIKVGASGWGGEKERRSMEGGKTRMSQRKEKGQVAILGIQEEDISFDRQIFSLLETLSKNKYRREKKSHEKRIYAEEEREGPWVSSTVLTQKVLKWPFGNLGGGGIEIK